MITKFIHTVGTTGIHACGDCVRRPLKGCCGRRSKNSAPLGVDSSRKFQVFVKYN